MPPIFRILQRAPIAALRRGDKHLPRVYAYCSSWRASLLLSNIELFVYISICATDCKTISATFTTIMSALELQIEVHFRRLFLSAKLGLAADICIIREKGIDAAVQAAIIGMYVHAHSCIG